ncbi:hypothetical protein GCM10028807_42130 [Spirosoma daeguense]
MATQYVVRSFRATFLAILLTSVFVSGCKKNGGSEVDLRDQYVGTYEGGYQSSIKIATLEFPPETGTTSVIVTKGANPKEIYIEVKLNRPFKVTAELEGNSFTIIDRSRDQVTINVNGKSTNYEGDFRATGVFDKNQIAITTTTETVQTGATISRIEAITGTRK